MSCLAFIQIRHEFFDSALVMKCFFDQFFLTFIPQHDLQSAGQKCHLTETLFEHIIIKYGLLKDFRIRGKM